MGPADDMMESATELTVDKRDSITRKEFIHDYVDLSKPVILTRATLKWKAIGKITPRYIQDKYGDRKKIINDTEYSYAELVDLIMNSTPQRPAPYPFSINIERELPEIMDDIKPELIYGKIDRINHPLVSRRMLYGTELYEIFLGGNGSSFPYLHYDLLFMHTQITQIYGSKEFILFPPDQEKYLYPDPANSKISQVDVFHPDYEKHPLFRLAKPLRATVLQGETIFFPNHWWHTTRIHEPCISIGRVQLNGRNWNLYLRDEFRYWKKRSSFLAYGMLFYGKAVGLLIDLQEKLMN